MTRIDRGQALRFGSFGAAIVFVPLAALVLGISGMECQECGIDASVREALAEAALFAALFGLVAGCAAAAVKPMLDRRIHPLAASLLLASAVTLLAAPALWSAPALYGYVEYLRTPRDRLPPGDPGSRPSDCPKRRLPPTVVCAT